MQDTAGTHSRTDAVRASALWAAAADALGWITELTTADEVVRRTGARTVKSTVPWARQFNGPFGFRVDFDAGTYSDDTQLRLAVCRAIRGNGIFDPEAFARIELPVWLGYALGAGKGSKAAAANLAKRGSNWYSNFFGKGSQYVNSGGNGAAMRIQPHVWASPPSSIGELHLAVFKNSIITHGHPHGFLGAAFHAVALHHALNNKETLGLAEMAEVVDSFGKVPELPQRDRQLANFWIEPWEQRAKQSLTAAVAAARQEALTDLELIAPLLKNGNRANYLPILNKLGCITPRFRGSGLKTAIAASVLCHFYRDDPLGAIVAAANALGSDTDTIGTMAGAILGAKSGVNPSMAIQDRAYIVQEAERLSRISKGSLEDSFAYPEISKFNAPSTQSDAVARAGGSFAVKGLGPAKPVGPVYESGDAAWQWLTLPFGQTVFAKRRLEISEEVSESMLPGERRVLARPTPRPHSAPVSPSKDENMLFPLPPTEDRRTPRSEAAGGRQIPPNILGRSHIDEWTDRIIAADFSDQLIGRLFNRCIDESGSIEGAIAFAAILAKARLARRRRNKG